MKHSRWRFASIPILSKLNQSMKSFTALLLVSLANCRPMSTPAPVHEYMVAPPEGQANENNEPDLRLRRGEFVDHIMGMDRPNDVDELGEEGPRNLDDVVDHIMGMDMRPANYPLNHPENVNGQNLDGVVDYIMGMDSRPANYPLNHEDATDHSNRENQRPVTQVTTTSFAETRHLPTQTSTLDQFYPDRETESNSANMNQRVMELQHVRDVDDVFSSSLRTFRDLDPRANVLYAGESSASETEVPSRSQRE